MSDYKLNTFVHAVEVDSEGNRTGREQVFGPDDKLSTPDNEWALAAITNKDVWADGRAPERKAPEPVESDEVAQLKARIAELEQAAAGSSKPDRYDGKSADELRTELKDRGLPTSGTKAEMVALLREHDAAKADAKK